MPFEYPCYFTGVGFSRDFIHSLHPRRICQEMTSANWQVGILKKMVDGMVGSGKHAGGNGVGLW